VQLSLLGSCICDIHPLAIKNPKHIPTQQADTFITIKN